MFSARNFAHVKHKVINLYVGNLPYAPFVATNVPFQCVIYILGSENSVSCDLAVGLSLLFSWFTERCVWRKLCEEHQAQDD
jgi:hypothetical protein